jgi:hypothetical protein
LTWTRRRERRGAGRRWVVPLANSERAQTGPSTGASHDQRVHRAPRPAGRWPHQLQHPCARGVVTSRSGQKPLPTVRFVVAVNVVLVESAPRSGGGRGRRGVGASGAAESERQRQRVSHKLKQPPTGPEPPCRPRQPAAAPRTAPLSLAGPRGPGMPRARGTTRASGRLQTRPLPCRPGRRSCACRRGQPRPQERERSNNARAAAHRGPRSSRCTRGAARAASC